MIEINLLPEELRKKEPQFKSIDLSKFKVNIQGIHLLKIGGGVASVLVVITVILFLMGIYTKINLASLEKRYRDISPKRKEAEALKSQIEAINKKVKAIDELMVKRFGWARKLADLSDSVTPGIWLTELSYTEKVVDRPVMVYLKNAKGKAPNEQAKSVMEKVLMKYLIISGYATGQGEDGTASVGKFIKSLKDNSSFYADFSDIELGAIKRDKIEDQEVMSFKITGLFKETK